jgi:large repetitive protein
LLIFAAFDPEHGQELWASDGTRRIKDLRPGGVSSGPDGLTTVRGRVFFSTDDGTSGRELFRLPLCSAWRALRRRFAD